MGREMFIECSQLWKPLVGLGMLLECSRLLNPFWEIRNVFGMFSIKKNVYGLFLTKEMECSQKVLS